VSNRRPEQDWAGGEGDPSLVEHIKLLSDAMSGTSVTELEVEEGGMRIRLQRQAIPMQPVAFAAAPVPLVAGQPAPAGAPAAEETAAEMTLAVMAPLTGVFYSSPSPETPPFVTPGDKVQPGQVVCMVEAMKVFNEIKTEIGGVVTAIPPKNGQLVKKGDPLVRIKPY
jgi:acetyl-CoA carboxylase biotin carboxyl carrier protein